MMSSRPPSPRHLCVCVDDLGQHPDIAQAVERLASMGRVHAVSCLVGGPAWSQAIPWVRHAAASGVDAGLHLDLTEFPLAPGSARSLPRVMFEAFAGRLPRERVRGEVRAQLDAFERAVGRPPDFVDGHRHVHQLPIVRDELLDELDQRAFPPQVWLRSTKHPRGWHGLPFGARVKAGIIERAGGRGLLARAKRRGRLCSGHLLGVHDFTADPEAYRALVSRWLDAASTGDILMCHPATGDCNDVAIGHARTVEWSVLSSDGFGQALSERHIGLASFSRIARGIGPPG